MTDIRWYWDDELCGVSAKGHAEFNPGNDIVCSAVSALMQTLYAGLEMQCYAQCILSKGDGRYEIDCAIGDNRGEVKALFDSIVFGLHLIAKEYPENVRVERIGVVEASSKGEGETPSDTL